MKSGLSKIGLILVYVLVGMVLGYVLAITKCKNKELDQVWPEIRKELNEFSENISKQTQKLDEKIKEVTEQTKKE